MNTDHPIFHMTDAEARAFAPDMHAVDMTDSESATPKEPVPDLISLLLRTAQPEPQAVTIAATGDATVGAVAAAASRLNVVGAPPAGSAVVKLPAGTVLRMGEGVDPRRAASMTSELLRDGTFMVTATGEVEVVAPVGWAMVQTRDLNTGGAAFVGSGAGDERVVPFTRTRQGLSGTQGTAAQECGFYVRSGRMLGHPLSQKAVLTRDGLTTSGGAPTEFSNAVRPILMPTSIPNMKGRLAATAETMGHIYRDVAIGLGRDAPLPGAGLTDFTARIHAEVEGGVPDGSAVRRFGFAFGGRAAMYYALRARLGDLAKKGERRDPRLPQSAGCPVYMTSAVSPLFPDFATARGYVESAVKGWQPLADTWLNAAIFVLGETDADVLNNISDFESGADGMQIDPALLERLKQARDAVHHTRRDRERQMQTDMSAPSASLADLVASADSWVQEWRDPQAWITRAEKIASAAHEASVLDVMALTVMLWRPTPATFALGPLPRTKGEDKLSRVDAPIGPDALTYVLQAEAANEAAAAMAHPGVAGRLLLRSAVLPACLRSLYGADVNLTNHGQVVNMGQRAYGLTLRSDESGRMDACLKGVRAQAALWAEVMHAAGLAPKWRV